MMMEAKNRYCILPARAFSLLLAGILFFLGSHLLGHTMKQLGHNQVFGLVRLFDMDRERNLPTLYSTGLFFLSGFLFYSVWNAKRGTKDSSWMWLLFGGVMVFLGVDESCQFHEYLNDIVDKYIETSGFFLAAWVIPYGSAALIGFGLVLPFLFRQGRETRFRLITSGAVFVCGAVGVEMLTAKYIDIIYAKIGGDFNKYTDFYYGLFVAVEESLEMFGLVLVIHALLRMLHYAHGGLTVIVPGVSESSVTTAPEGGEK